MDDCQPHSNWAGLKHSALLAFTRDREFHVHPTLTLLFATASRTRESREEIP
jgi:hypothetical protein